MIAEGQLEFTPTSSWLRLAVTRPAEHTSGGLWRPEVSRQRPPEGTVTAVGPGRVYPGSEVRSVIWPQVGDVVIFDPRTFVEITDAFDGLVSAEEVVGVVDPETEEITPENDFVCVEPDERERETTGGILRPEGYRQAAKSGTILDFGPGEVRRAGPLVGIRRTIRAILALSETERLIGRRVWWEGKMESFSLGGAQPCVMIHASDLFAIE